MTIGFFYDDLLFWGGELFGLVKKFMIMNLNVSRFFIIQILLGIEKIHKNGIVYRDFKP